MAPPGTTHFSTGYDHDPIRFYKQSPYQHLNQVSEEWQELVRWFYWDDRKQKWESCGEGFSSRRLKKIEELT